MIRKIKGTDPQKNMKYHQASHGPLKGYACGFHSRKFVVFGQISIGD